MVEAGSFFSLLSLRKCLGELLTKTTLFWQQHKSKEQLIGQVLNTTEAGLHYPENMFSRYIMHGQFQTIFHTKKTNLSLDLQIV